MFYKSFIVICVSLFMVIPVNDEIISWRDNVKLTWSQFKAAPKTNTSAVALTASGITFEFSVKETAAHIVDFEAKVYAHFYPKKSWYIKAQGDAHILAHEQLHFDITELHARKFRKQISQLKVNNNIKTQLRVLHEKINKELANTQQRYDRESDHSVNRELQAKWNDFVKTELTKLEAYKSQD